MAQNEMKAKRGLPVEVRSMKGLGVGIWLRRVGLQKIPQIAVDIFEDGYRSVRFCLWLANERDALGLVALIVACQVVSVKKEEDAATSLVAYARLLFNSGSSCQKKTRFT